MVDAAPQVRVLVVHPRDLADPTGGGIQTFLQDFIAHAPADFEFTVAGVSSDSDVRPVGAWSSIRLGDHAVRFLPITSAGSSPWSHPRASLAGLRRLYRELRRPGTILQVHRPYRGLLFAAHRGRRVQFVHLDIASWPGPGGWKKASWAYRGFLNGLGGVDRVFVANEAGVGILRSSHPELADRIRFLPGWYDDGRYRPRPSAERDELRASLGGGLAAKSGPGEKWVLFVGRLDEVKDPLLAVQAFATFMKKVSAAGAGSRLIVAGDGEMRDEVLAAAEASGFADRVHVLGDQPRDAVADFMAAADVLLVTSRSEGGGPRVVLEALGSGLPVVTTAVGEVRRTIRPGRNGCIVEDRAASSLAAGLEWAVAQPRDTVIAEALDAIRPFTASSVLSGLYEQYRELARESSTAGSHEARRSRNP